MPVVFVIFLLIVLIGGGFIYCMRPSQDNMRKARFKNIQKYYIAHGGLYSDAYDAPINTMEAFRRAISYGFGIELAVRLTKDKKVVVIDDDNLSRLCGVNVSVEGSDYSEIKGHTIKGTKERVPLLSDVLSEVGGRVPVIIEIKYTPMFGELCRAVGDIAEAYEGDIAVESAQDEIVAWFRTNKSDILRGQMGENFFGPRSTSTDEPLVKFKNTFMLMNYRSQPDFIAYDFMEFDGIVMKIMRSVFGVETLGRVMTSQTCIDDLSKKFDIIVFEGFIPKEKQDSLF